ncbi:MAG: hypothetical protein ACK2UC_10045 [Anaerolineae bacterium]|jgi:hypothetical protein
MSIEIVHCQLTTPENGNSRLTGEWPCAIISLSALRVKVHICGDGTRHFKTRHDEIGAYEFDTGFPVDFGGLRQQLGPEVTLWGGPDIMVLKDGAPEQVRNLAAMDEATKAYTGLSRY